jgi:hypothetical protein
MHDAIVPQRSSSTPRARVCMIRSHGERAHPLHEPGVSALTMTATEAGLRL